VLLLVQCTVETRRSVIIDTAVAQTPEEVCARYAPRVARRKTRDEPSSAAERQCRDASATALDVLAQHLAVVGAVRRRHEGSGYILNMSNIELA